MFCCCSFISLNHVSLVSLLVKHCLLVIAALLSCLEQRSNESSFFFFVTRKQFNVSSRKCYELQASHFYEILTNSWRKSSTKQNCIARSLKLLSKLIWTVTAVKVNSVTGLKTWQMLCSSQATAPVCDMHSASLRNRAAKQVNKCLPGVKLPLVCCSVFSYYRHVALLITKPLPRCAKCLKYLFWSQQGMLVVNRNILCSQVILRTFL